ncbi:MAG: sodium-extruding oxaloacetate decarboxylase subunit alpha [Gammaproteobacteria bacterium]|jgi:oxaloacetate decarboxylase alpha subunit
MANPLKITELVLRDAHQSLLATRLRIEDMLPMAPQLDRIGYWSMESWGGATFDACIRYLGEDPWERLRKIKAAMPNTPQQMLLRGQNLLGYRHYADDVVETFVNRAAANGVDVFRIFDALNDVRNLETAIKATIKAGKHAQGTISYTVSPVHTVDKYVEMGREMQELGCHSIAIKDMAGLLKPYVAWELVSKLKRVCDIPIMMQSHATTGMSTVTNIKAAEAGIDGIDTAISPLSMTYGHSATESVVAILQGTERDTGLDLQALDEIAAYFRTIRRKYAQFEGSLRGVDARILLAQVPGGMLTNMEKQLRDQGAIDSFDKVLEEIPRVRKDLGYIPLVTPTSQIVGTQAVLNVLLGERYKSITKETQAILRGEYGQTPIPVDKELQQRVLQGGKAVTQRPADLLEPELQKLADELDKLADEHRFTTNGIDDVLTYALFPQIGLKFLRHRGDPSAFEPPPDPAAAAKAAAPAKAPAPAATAGPERYSVTVNGRAYDVVVAAGGEIEHVEPMEPAKAASAPASSAPAAAVEAPLSGTIFKVVAKPGQSVAENDLLIVLEAMKMETEVRAPRAGQVATIDVREGDSVELGATLLTLS